MLRSSAPLVELEVHHGTACGRVETGVHYRCRSLARASTPYRGRRACEQDDAVEGEIISPGIARHAAQPIFDGLSMGVAAEVLGERCVVRGGE